MNTTMSPKQRREHRRNRLIDLIKQHFDDNQAKFAEAAGVAANLVSRYVGGTKGIGEDMRNKLEGNTGYIGWFDESPAITPNPEKAPKYVDLPAGIRGERRVPLLTWGDLRDDKIMLNCTTHSGPTAIAPGDNVADNAFAVAYDSDAFLSDIPRSATLIINPGTTWETGRLALMECSGAIVLRRLAMDGERSMLIAHDAANWNATPLNPMSDRIIGLVACAYKNF